MIDRGRVLQLGNPQEILARPADPFVARFVGAGERGLKLLALGRVGERMRPGEHADGAPVAPDLPLSAALSEMVTRGVDRLAVADGSGAALGALLLADIVRQA